MQSARLATGGLTSQAARLSTGLGVGGTQAAYLRSVNSAQNAMSAHLHGTSLAARSKETLEERAKGPKAHLSTKPIGAVKSQVNPNTGAVQSGQIFGMKRK